MEEKDNPEYEDGERLEPARELTPEERSFILKGMQSPNYAKPSTTLKLLLLKGDINLEIYKSRLADLKSTSADSLEG